MNLKATIGPWGIEQTTTHNWIGPLRKDGKVDEIVCSTDREGLKPECIERNDANARLLASAWALRSALEGIMEYAHDGASVRDIDTFEQPQFVNARKALEDSK